MNAFYSGSMPDNHSRRIYLEAFGTLLPTTFWFWPTLIMAVGSLGYGLGIWLAARPEGQEEIDKAWAKLRSFKAGGQA